MIIVGIDPGRTTGYAVLDARTMTLVCAGVINGTAPAQAMLRLLDEARPRRIIVEDWENQGRRVDMAAAWPNRVIGYVEALAAVYGVELTYAPASRWKPAFGSGAHCLPPPPVRLAGNHDRTARRIIVELGTWPRALAEAPRSSLPHVIDAVGLACWAALGPPKLGRDHG